MLTLFILATGLIFALSARAQQKPFTQEQVSNMVRAGLGDESGAKLIEQRGIDFAPAEDFFQSLKAAGASEVFLKALRAAKPPGPASAKIRKPEIVDPAAEARQAEIRQHVARAAEFLQSKRYTDAENEIRAAIQLDTQNSDLHHVLGAALGERGDWDGAIVEYREALRLNPNNDLAHASLGAALGQKGNWDGEIAEEHAAMRLNPNNGVAHDTLGFALGKEGDWNGALTEERAALRLDPNNDVAHYHLGFALEQQGDRQGALEEYRAAYKLDPKDATYKQNYERLLQQGNH
jgi:tetratricopeptide (TPR) repeat protein